MNRPNTMDEPTDFFWQTAAAFLDDERVTKGTMMGFPCLRVEGNFFASAEPKTGDLIIKLPAQRVQAMIAAGDGGEFAPAGRKFKEWVRVEDRDADRWEQLLSEALVFVDGKS